MMFLFDLDGTLIDSLDDLKDATEHALKLLGYPGHPREKYQYFVGNGVKKLLQRAFDTEDENIYQQARQLFDEYYGRHCLDHTIAYPGIESLIQQLHDQGHIIGVVTNKPDALAKKICKGIFGDRLDFVQGQIDSVPVKPNPYFVNQARKTYRMSVAQTVFIGDSNVDIFTGQNAGIRTIGVTWGNRTRQELAQAGADDIVDDTMALATVLKELVV